MTCRSSSLAEMCRWLSSPADSVVVVTGGRVVVVTGGRVVVVTGRVVVVVAPRGLVVVVGGGLVVVVVGGLTVVEVEVEVGGGITTGFCVPVVVVTSPLDCRDAPEEPGS